MRLLRQIIDKTLFYLKKIEFLKQFGFFRELNIYISAFLMKKPNIPPTKFVLFTQGRTGGVLLFDLLTSNSDIHYDGEVLAQKKLFPEVYIKSRCKLSQKKIYGIKIKIYELTRQQGIQDPKQFMIDLHKMGFKIVYLKRHNCLRQVLSLSVAEHRDAAHHKKTDGPLRIEKIHVDPDERLLELIKERQDFLAMEKEILEGLPHISTVYEDDLLREENHQRTAAKIFHYLGLPTVPVKVEQVRITSDNLSEFIENYDELEKFLIKTEYAKFLDDQREGSVR